MADPDALEGHRGLVVAQTERLVIRPWRFEEAPRVLDIQSRIEVVKWYEGPSILFRAQKLAPKLAGSSSG